MEYTEYRQIENRDNSISRCIFAIIFSIFCIFTIAYIIFLIVYHFKLSPAFNPINPV